MRLKTHFEGEMKKRFKAKLTFWRQDTETFLDEIKKDYEIEINNCFEDEVNKSFEGKINIYNDKFHRNVDEIKL